MDHVGLGQRADVAVQGGPLRAQHSRQICVGQPVADDALHQRAPVVVLDVAHPLRSRKPSGPSLSRISWPAVPFSSLTRRKRFLDTDRMTVAKVCKVATEGNDTVHKG